MVEYIVFKATSDTIDSFILWLAGIGVVLGSFSVGATIFLLIDKFKRKKMPTDKDLAKLKKKPIMYSHSKDNKEMQKKEHVGGPDL